MGQEEWQQVGQEECRRDSRNENSRAGGVPAVGTGGTAGMRTNISTLTASPLEIPLKCLSQTHGRRTFHLDPLNSIPLNSIPLNSIPLNSIPLNSVPLNSVPLNSVPLNSVPLNSVPLNSTPSTRPPHLWPVSHEITRFTSSCLCPVGVRLALLH
ncbi:hypothetical protein Pcinc_009959 [Petrolisthes cinctipes]|uniref:Uncharacterized protein n=1 Tax=Petrolisthes cinctipes TaxID=88211 RepID=A0AAE1G5V1_PETCI|nr:hypothetical protein Pcinc_009959 [Petrolisthes cinctipes]